MTGLQDKPIWGERRELSHAQRFGLNSAEQLVCSRHVWEEWYTPDLSAPKSQIAMAAIIRRKGQFAGRLRRSLPSWPELLQNNFLEQLNFVIIFVIVTKIVSTRTFSLQCCCHWFVPVCKRTCEGICFVKRLFWNFYKISCAKTILFEKYFCNNFGRDGSLV